MGLRDTEEMLDACRDHATELEMRVMELTDTTDAIRAFTTPSAEAGAHWAVMVLAILDGRA